MKNIISMKNFKLGLFLFLMIAIILATKLFNMSINPIIIDIIYIVFLIFFSKDELLYLLAFNLPLVACFDKSAHLLLIYLFLIILKGKFKFNLKFIFFSVLFILLELFAHYYYHVSDINRMLGYLTCIIIFLYILLELPKDNINHNRFIKYYIAGTISLFIIYFSVMINHNGVNALNLILNSGKRFGIAGFTSKDSLNISLNSNTIAYYSIVAMFLPISLKGGKKNTFLYYFIPIFMFLFGFLTKSRSYLIIALLGLLMSIFTNLKTRKQIMYYIIIAFSLLIFLYWLFNTENIIMTSFLNRFSESSFETAGGRTTILELYNNLFFSNSKFVLFGSGVTDYTIIYNIDYATHNGLQQALICYGLIGFVPFMYLILKPIIEGFKKRIVFKNYIPFIVSFLFIQTIQLLNPNMLLFPFAICCLLLEVEINKKERLEVIK